MLSTVLRSETAIRVSIRIMDAFVAMKRFMVTNAEVFQRLSTMEYYQLEMQQHLQETDKRIDEVFRRLDEGNAKPKQGVFYNGQIYDAYTFVSDLVKSAKKRIILIDSYVDETVLTLLDKRENSVSAIIYTQQISRQFQLDIDRHNAQYAPIDVETFFFLLKLELNHYFIGTLFSRRSPQFWYTSSKISRQRFSLIFILVPIAMKSWRVG